MRTYKPKVTCRSYLKVGDGFVPVRAFTGALPDRAYVYGAIELEIGRKTIFDTALWDLVDQLWAYLVNAMEDLARGSPCRFWFPDQPLEVEFDILKGDEVRIDVPLFADRYAKLDRKYFVMRILGEAKRFFAAMNEITGGVYSREITRIERIERDLV